MKVERDFTLKKYVELCETILKSNYEVLTLERYFEMREKPERFVILRHDVDDGADLPYTLAMARKEAELGVTSTYYFRVNDDVFIPEVIEEVKSLDHEIGYHYDVLGKASGDYEKAIKLFEEELNRLREIYDVKTIAMHGGPFATGLNAATFTDLLKVIGNILSGRKTFVSWDSRDIWKKYDFREYGIIGDAYLSIDFNEVAYFSDTNRSWSDTKRRIKDFVDSNTNSTVINTNDLINIVNNCNLDKMLILTHPPNWRYDFSGWLKWLVLQQVKNVGKSCLQIYWKRNSN